MYILLGYDPRTQLDQYLTTYEQTCNVIEISQNQQYEVTSCFTRLLKTDVSGRVPRLWFERWTIQTEFTWKMRAYLRLVKRIALLMLHIASFYLQSIPWLALFGTFGNVLVCLAVATNTVLRQSSNYLLGSLAVADLITFLICEPLFLEILIRKSLYNDCARTIVERVYFDVSNFSAASSVLHMYAISIDRFIVLVFPLRHRTCMKGAGIKALLISCWLVTIVLFLLSRYYRAPIAKKAFINLAIFLFGFLIIFVAYILIVISLLKQKRRIVGLRVQSFKDVSSRYEAHVAYTLAIVIIVFTAFWFPLFIVFAAAGKMLVKRNGITHYWIRTLTISNSKISERWRRANARNVSFSISVRWSIYIINSVDKPNFLVSLPHRRSTTVSLETNPPYLKLGHELPYLWTEDAASVRDFAQNILLFRKLLRINE